MGSKIKAILGSKKLFIFLMMVYPIAQLLVVFCFVNIKSLMLVFQKFSLIEGDYVWFGLGNIKWFFEQLTINEMFRQPFINSFLYFPVSCFISLPLSVIFSYFLFKKVCLNGVFRIIFFIPNIIPVVALAQGFKLPFDPNIGFIPDLFGGADKAPLFFGGIPDAQIMIYIYCIWAGLGYNIILLSGAMGRIPEEVLESARMDGVGPFREMVQFVVPLVWPSITTLFIIGMSSPLTIYLQPMLLTNGILGTSTISMDIFKVAQTGRNIQSAATTGLLCSLFYSPLILISRNILGKFWADVDF